MCGIENSAGKYLRCHFLLFVANLIPILQMFVLPWLHFIGQYAHFCVDSFCLCLYCSSFSGLIFFLFFLFAVILCTFVSVRIMDVITELFLFPRGW